MNAIEVLMNVNLLMISQLILPEYRNNNNVLKIYMEHMNKI